MKIYRVLFILFLSRIDEEWAHTLASWSLRTAWKIWPLRMLLIRWLVPDDERLAVETLKMNFRSPFGIAAGVDKDASWFDPLLMIGAGFVEVGTVTARKQDGNPKPRVARLTKDGAILNKMGFPNPGAAKVADRLARRSGMEIVGANIGKSRDASVDEIGDDYRQAARALAPHADYLVVNVSSPNTPGLVEMQAVALLEPLVEEVRDELTTAGIKKPIFVKIGPDLSDEQIDEVAQLAVKLELNGIVAVNTTSDRSGIHGSIKGLQQFDGGGISGEPLKARALHVLQRLHAIVEDDVVLVSVGGVRTAEDVMERIRAGATLVQAHTGFVYEGPGWPKRINRRLAELVTEAKVEHITDLVGTGNGSPAANSSANGDGTLPPSNGRHATAGIGAPGSPRSRVA
jgi:dihydroorotate dehydrogenase